MKQSKKNTVLMITMVLVMSLPMLMSCDPGEVVIPVNPYDSVGIEDPDNPIDPTDTTVVPPTYIPPESEILSGPSEGEVMSHHEVTFNWTGSSTTSEYQWKIDDKAWSDWSADTLTTISYLDEGEHVFQLQGRAPTGDVEDVAKVRTFSVNAVSGPALRYYPRYVNTAVSGTSFTVAVVLEEVTDLAGVQIIIPYANADLELVNYTVFDSAGDFLLGDEGQVLEIDSNDADNGILTVNMSLVGTVKSVSGTGPVIALDFNYSGSGSQELDFDVACQFQDENLQEITIQDKISCVIE